MIGFSRIRSFIVFAGVLAVSAGWTFSPKPELAAQSAPDGTLDPYL